MIWRELKDCNGDNLNPLNYCIKLQSLGSSGTSLYVRDPNAAKQDEGSSGSRLKSAMKGGGGGEGKPVKIPKDEVVTLEYDMLAEMGIVLGHKLFGACKLAESG